MSVATTYTAADSNETDLRPGHDIIRPATSASFRTGRPQTSSGPTARRPPPRPATATQKESARAPRTVKPKATAPVKTETAAVQPAANARKTSAESANAAKPADKSASPEAGGDLDNITSGMKRIKINVLTKEKKEARQREAAEKAAAEKMAAEQVMSDIYHTTEIAGSPANSVDAPMNERPFSPPDVPTHSSGSPSIRSQPSPIPTIYEAPSETQEAESTDGAIPSIVTTPTIETHPPPAFTQSSSPPTTSTPTPTTPDLFVPYQPEGPTPESLPISGPIRILDPNTGTPAPNNRSPKKAPHFPPFNPRDLGLSPEGKGQGHGFTATSPIPFATPRPATSAGDGRASADSTKEKPKRVWEVKETPQLHRRI